MRVMFPENKRKETKQTVHEACGLKAAHLLFM